MSHNNSDVHINVAVLRSQLVQLCPSMKNLTIVDIENCKWSMKRNIFRSLIEISSGLWEYHNRLDDLMERKNKEVAEQKRRNASRESVVEYEHMFRSNFMNIVLDVLVHLRWPPANEAFSDPLGRLLADDKYFTYAAMAYIATSINPQQQQQQQQKSSSSHLVQTSFTSDGGGNISSSINNNNNNNNNNSNNNVFKRQQNEEGIGEEGIDTNNRYKYEDIAENSIISCSNTSASLNSNNDIDTRNLTAGGDYKNSNDQINKQQQQHQVSTNKYALRSGGLLSNTNCNTTTTSPDNSISKISISNLDLSSRLSNYSQRHQQPSDINNNNKYNDINSSLTDNHHHYPNNNTANTLQYTVETLQKQNELLHSRLSNMQVGNVMCCTAVLYCTAV